MQAAKMKKTKLKAYANNKLSTSRLLCMYVGRMTKHGLYTKKVSESRELVDFYSGTYFSVQI